MELTRKLAIIVLRTLHIVMGLILSILLTVVLVTMSNYEHSKTPIQVYIALTICVVTTIHIIVALILTILRRTLYVTAIGDILSLGAMITCAILTRTAVGSYECHGWLRSATSPNVNSPSSSPSETSGDKSGGGGDPAATLVRRDEPAEEPSVCGIFEGVFGVSIVGCVFFIVTFQLLLLAIRTQKRIAIESRGQVETYWRQEGMRGDMAARRSHAPPHLDLERRDSSSSEDSDMSDDMKAFENVPLPITPNPTIPLKGPQLPPKPPK